MATDNLLEQCYRSGQMSEKEHQEHIHHGEVSLCVTQSEKWPVYVWALEIVNRDKGTYFRIGFDGNVEHSEGMDISDALMTFAERLPDAVVNEFARRKAVSS